MVAGAGQPFSPEITLMNLLMGDYAGVLLPLSENGLENRSSLFSQEISLFMLLNCPLGT
jgi:hypothetical protein